MKNGIQNFGFFPSPPKIGELMGVFFLQVYSCWNGINVISTSVFLDARMNFRTRLSKNHPPSCESQNIGVDMWDKGYHRIFVNPRIHVAYNYGIFSTFFSPFFPLFSPFFTFFPLFFCFFFTFFSLFFFALFYIKYSDRQIFIHKLGIIF